MTKQLYEEALADVKKLKEVAEDNAKKALIEAVAPRIKDLIEAELFREAADEDLDDKLLFDVEAEMPASPGAAMMPGITVEPSGAVLDLDQLSVAPADDMAGASDEFVLGMDAEAEPEPAPLMDKLGSAAALNFESKLMKLDTRAKKYMNASSQIRSIPVYGKIVSEMVSEVEELYQYLQEAVGNHKNKELYENKLENIYKDLNQLTEQNMKNRLSETTLGFKLDLGDDLPEEAVDAITKALEASNLEIVDEEGEEAEGGEGEAPEGEEGGEEEGGAELDLDLGGDDEKPEGEEESEEPKEAAMAAESRRLRDDVIVEIDEGMLRREIARMKTLREADDVQAWGHGAGDVSDDMDFEDDDLGDPLELDVTTEAVAEDVHEMTGESIETEMVGEYAADEAVDVEGSNQRKEVKRQPEAAGVTESLNKRLARERALQLEAKKKAHAAKKAATEASAKKKKAKTVKEKAGCAAREAKLKEAYNYFATQYNESVRRSARLQTMLAEASKRKGESLNGSSTRTTEASDNLRKKLAETNLFNMKLLYTNKLLQNESLTKRQKADVIERLDEATTEREVKLVYESVVKTLSNKNRALTEGSNRVLGSSSAPTRAASTVLNEGFEADRWAKLAGIK